MEHIAIDLGGRESQICVRDAAGQILEERRAATSGLSRYLATRSAGRVVLETCAEAFKVADAAIAAGHEVRVVPATLVRSLGVGARRTKTDRRDAQILSEVSCRIDLPSVHVPTIEARRTKAMCTMRDSLVRARVQLSNCLRGWLRTEGIRLRAGGVETLPRRLRDQVKELPSYVTRQLEILDELTAKIVEAEREQAKLAKQNECARRLMTTPGVGPNTALRFIALLDDIERFPSAHKVEAYLGLVPGEDSSSDRQRRTGITKAGSPAMRHTLVQAAWAARRCLRQGPMQAWACEVERRRGKRVAALALARKLAGILFALWRDGSTYDARRGAATAS